jgi:hypothetical protein
MNRFLKSDRLYGRYKRLFSYRMASCQRAQLNSLGGKP